MELESFEEKHELLKSITILATSLKKKTNQVIMIKLFRKNTGSLMNYKELICLQQTTCWYLQLKKGVLYKWKKDLEESLRRKISLGKTCSLFHQKLLRIMQIHKGSFSNFSALA